MANFKEQDQQEIMISYLTLRKLLGFLGMFLPVLLLLGSLCMHRTIQSSISAYYYSPMRDWFVGILCCMAVFLFSYTGYEEPGVRIKENLLTNLAGILAFCIALLSTMGNKEIHIAFPGHRCPIPSFANVFGSNLECNSKFISGAHLGCAALFFLILTGLLYFKFVKIKNPEGRQWEINLYKGCGIVMFVCIGIMLLHELLVLLVTDYPFAHWPVLFIFESIALWAFGIAWLVKGKAHEDVTGLVARFRKR